MDGVLNVLCVPTTLELKIIRAPAFTVEFVIAVFAVTFPVKVTIPEYVDDPLLIASVPAIVDAGILTVTSALTLDPNIMVHPAL